MWVIHRHFVTITEEAIVKVSVDEPNLEVIKFVYMLVLNTYIYNLWTFTYIILIPHTILRHSYL
jgi:hypothetical protein